MSCKELGVFGRLSPPQSFKCSLVKVLDGRYKKGFYMAQVHQQMEIKGKPELLITKWDERKLKWVWEWVLGWRAFPEEVDFDSL